MFLDMMTFHKKNGCNIYIDVIGIDYPLPFLPWIFLASVLGTHEVGLLIQII
jgi:hypothetical protein